MMDERTQEIVLDAVYACPDPQVHDFYRQLMLEKDNIFLAFALECTFTKFKEVFHVQLEQDAEIKYTSDGVPVVRSKHELLEKNDMVNNSDTSIDAQLFDQLERLSDATLSDEALQEEIDNSSLLCLKTQIQIQIDENMMLLKQIRSTAPLLLSQHPDVEDCFQSQSACLKRLLHSVTSSVE